MIKASPCLNCKDRVIGCHSTCKKYKEYFDENEKRKEKLRKKQEVSYVVNGYNKNKTKSIQVRNLQEKKEF